MKKKSHGKYWIVFIAIMVILIFFFYYLSYRHSQRIETSNLDTYELMKTDVFFEDFTMQEQDDHYIFSVYAGTNQQIEEFHNWVLGSGNGIHYNVHIALIKDEIVFQLKTLPASTSVALDNGNIIENSAKIQSILNKSKLEQGTYIVALLLKFDNDEKLYITNQEVQIKEV